MPLHVLLDSIAANHLTTVSHDYLVRASTRRAGHLAPRPRTQAASLARHIKAHDLDDGDSAARALESLRQRLSTDRLSVAFVAEFSRGKSELINAIFFGDTGRRILPATPGRTTMCPVEIAYDVGHTAAPGAAADRDAPRVDAAGAMA